jgi:hypothetical protein
VLEGHIKTSAAIYEQQLATFADLREAWRQIQNDKTAIETERELPNHDGGYQDVPAPFASATLGVAELASCDWSA